MVDGWDLSYQSPVLSRQSAIIPAGIGLDQTAVDCRLRSDAW